ncbi:M18 family aminopeptidase [Bulleidia sp. zg-1006]|uniref:M18 family aminopeptidase n=1 Tax=Bulleidia sp. zg-1006 TaxID=2806552 RepID=UPI001939E484|nr:M18 family aminopeptidase [Bulleidia sp. zg-1006]QRG86572.1 M18 family aminopeptidase [Bulleidia sp. zg-1006]
MIKNVNEQLMNFINASPTAYHAIHQVKEKLRSGGYTELQESENWDLEEDGRYFVCRNGSSILAFRVPCKDYHGFMIGAAHSDSPSFKLKENSEIEKEGYLQLNVEGYGGMLMAPWFDRPLGIAGRVVVKDGNFFSSYLVNSEETIAMIPNLAIHIDRNANENHSYNIQNDLLPMIAQGKKDNQVLRYFAEKLKIEEKNILSHDLFLYPREKAYVWGMNQEFLTSPRLDDLQCAFANLYGFLGAKDAHSIPVMVIFDNEEVGSLTKQGADSTFLSDCLSRIHQALGHDLNSYPQVIANSMMVSADNAHGVHPNYVAKHDPVNHPKLNEGIVIKFNANQHYTTDGISAALFKDICQSQELPFQVFTNRSDVRGGSTLGNISNAHVSLVTVDVGLAQLAMHSPVETAGVKDTAYLIDALAEFFSRSLVQTKSGYEWK